MDEIPPKTVFVSGHRNPDIDSLASSFALAELRRRQDPGTHFLPICPGILPERAGFLFNKFHLCPPESRGDVYLRVSDIMDSSIPTIPVGTAIMDAVRILNGSGYARLPVIGPDQKFAGMMSPLNLLSRLLDIGKDTGSSFTGRLIHSSIDLITRVIEAKKLTAFETDRVQDLHVYVAAMGVDSFETHLPREKDQSLLALISGDRPEIHLRALQRRIRLLIVTGDKSVDPLILKEAKNSKVTILATRFDSASVIRRLKFSVPVEDFGFGTDPFILNPHDRIRGLEQRILAHPEDVFPVIDSNGSFLGVIAKKNITAPPPYRMILVDHNEPEQSIPGIEDIPVIEVVDHHRIGMMRTQTPIKFTGDVVGSTCTLVASMFKSMGESLTPELAGLLLGGLVADTLNLKSPTASALDFRMHEWLQKISGVKAADLMEELSRIASPLSAGEPRDVIESDRKSYSDGRFRFSLSQVEETKLELLRRRKDELAAAMREIMQQENLQFIALLVTDAVRETSELLILGDPAVIRSLPYRAASDGLFLLPGILSRKKQLLPQILAITADLNRR
ncbi:MAG: putative manganese-dependent inorganic diphosphatase [Lentisphaeria bacterium]|nr:putative manganese-dependent inorganic diphosphatase [Lentisphaeria bacterium]